MTNPLSDCTPRILRANGRVEPLTKPLSLAAFADLLGCQCFAIFPLPALSRACGKDMVMVGDQLAVMSLAPVNKAATAIFNANRSPALGPIQGHVAILPDGHMGGFYPEVPHA